MIVQKLAEIVLREYNHLDTTHKKRDIHIK